MRLPIAALCLFAVGAYAVDAGHNLRGYTPEDSAKEISWEQKFRELPDRDHIRENMRRLSARPHHVGSPYDKDNAEWLLAQLKSYGLDAQIEKFRLCSRRRSRASWSCWGRRQFTAKLAGADDSVDPTSSQTSEQLPTYNAYSIDGDVTAPLVYVNYGTPGGLRGAGTHGRLGEGRDRDRALRQCGAASSRKWRPSMAPSAA